MACLHKSKVTKVATDPLFGLISLRRDYQLLDKESSYTFVLGFDDTEQIQHCFS